MIVLDHLTAWELAPPALIEGAAEAGFDAVSLWFHAPPDGVTPYPIVGDTPMRRETIARARESGVAIFSIGLFVLSPSGWMPEWNAMLESGAAMGAQRAVVLHYYDDAESARDLLSRLVESAAAHGIGVDVEFIAGSGLRSLGDACNLVRSIGGDCGVILDPLHLQRTGGSPADIDDAARALIRYAQLCDGPSFVPPEQWLQEGSRQRQLPGEGEFPLAAFVSALPSTVPIGLEIPLTDLALLGIGPVDRARRALAAARPFLSMVRSEPA